MNTTSFSRMACAAAGAVACGATALVLMAGQAQAANFSKDVYKAAKQELDTLYDGQKKACNAQSGNAKDVCEATAKGQEKVAMAQLSFNQSGSARDETKLHEAQYSARHDIAKEKCDDLSGNAKDVCVKAADGERDKAKADLKLVKKVGAATEDAMEAHTKADYKVAIEKCDAQSGQAKDVCTASAKARFNVRW